MKFVYLICGIMLCLLTACGPDNQNIKSARERQLEMQITQQYHRIQILEDSLATVRGLYDSLTNPSADAVHRGRANRYSGAENIDPTEPSLYKNVVYQHVHIRQPGNTPGLFPEASDRLLFIKDVENLSEWGLQIMLNEIYARHGLIFNNSKLINHFKSEKWYKATATNVNTKLSTTEIRNIEFIKTYKYTPDPQSNSKNLNNNIPQVE